VTERFANEISTTLVGSITNVATSLVVASSSGFPAVNFRIRIDDEILLVTTVAGTTWTVTRAQEGTTGAAHSNAASVAHILTAGGLVQALGEVVEPTEVALSGSTTSASFVTLATIAFTAAGGLCYLSWTTAISTTSALLEMVYSLDGAADVYMLYKTVTGADTAAGELSIGTPSAGAHSLVIKYRTSSGTFAAGTGQARVREYK
jgi:fructose-1,6-bisphosphatase/inositol monophosphatase family enzyme